MSPIGKLVLLLVCAGVCAAAAAREAAACTCDYASHACEVMDRTAAVFVGRVLKIDGGGRLGPAITYFAVREVLHGNVDVTVAIHDSSCEFTFERGKEYLVYASQEPGEPLKTGRCSRTSLLSDPQVQADLRYLRSLSSRKLAHVHGAVSLDGKPSPGTPVRAQGTRWETTSGADGAYRLELPPGSYTITAEVPGTVPRTEPVTLGDTAACARADFPLRWNGRIRGRLVDPLGKPAAKVYVQARIVGEEQPYASRVQTDANGGYEFSGLAAGAYYLVVGHTFDPAEGRPTTYYPGVPDQARARPVKVPRAGLVADIDFKLPAAYRMRKIEGRVVAGPDHSRKARVLMRNTVDRREQEVALTTNGAGGVAFAFAERDGVVVTIQACDGYDGELGSCSQRITAKLDRDLRIELELAAKPASAPAPKP